MRVASSDPRVRRLVELIADTVTANGGYVHPDLVVNHDGANLWLSLPRTANPHLTGADGRPLDAPHPDAPALLVIPHDLHIPVTDLDWEASDTLLRYRADARHLSQAQRTILDAMVDLFNAVDKVREIGQAYARHSLENDPALLEMIREARPGFDLRSHAEDAEPPPSPAHSVMRSRLRSEMGEGDEGPIGFFMPLIDLLNHHPYGSRYERTDGGDWLIRVHHPTDTDQVFVRYNRADALGVAIGLGYIERDTRFVASVACEVAVDDIGRVRVAGVGAHRRRVPAPRLLPTADGLRVAGLVLTADGVDSVATLLAMPLRAMRPELSTDDATTRACNLLIAVTEANQAYYTRLRDLCWDTSQGDAQLRSIFAQVSDHQLALLARVKNSLNASAATR